MKVELQAKYPWLEVSKFAFGGVEETGWRKLIEQMFVDLDVLLRDSGKKFTLLQIKEKFAELRVYFQVDGAMRESVQEIVNKAVSASEVTCIRCGEPGVVREDRWITVLCDKHATEKI